MVFHLIILSLLMPKRFSFQILAMTAKHQVIKIRQSIFIFLIHVFLHLSQYKIKRQNKYMAVKSDSFLFKLKFYFIETVFLGCFLL